MAQSFSKLRKLSAQTLLAAFWPAAGSLLLGPLKIAIASDVLQVRALEIGLSQLVVDHLVHRLLLLWRQFHQIGVQPPRLIVVQIEFGFHRQLIFDLIARVHDDSSAFRTATASIATLRPLLAAFCSVFASLQTGLRKAFLASLRSFLSVLFVFLTFVSSQVSSKSLRIRILISVLVTARVRRTLPVDLVVRAFDASVT